MDTKNLHKLIKWHDKIKNELKAEVDELKESQAERKGKLDKIQVKLQEVIHKDNDEGLAKVTLPDKSLTAYSRYEDKVKVQDRDHLIEDYVLEGVPQKYVKQLRERLNIFGNTLVKDHVQDYRLDTGAEDENGRLVGGDLPPGVGMYVHKDVRIIKGNK